jgi:hypothetical protein
MVALLPTFNPASTTVGQGLFSGATAAGLVQGTAFADPATRFQLRGCILATTEALPMFGGMAVYENVPGVSTAGPRADLGPVCGRATTVTGGAYPIAGFSVFDQAYGMINNPASPVPAAASNMQVATYRIGSGARIAVACDPGLISLRNGPINSPVAWDFVNQILIPYTGPVAVNSGTYASTTAATAYTYNSLTGQVSLTFAAGTGLRVGGNITVTGANGTGAFASINGTYVVTSNPSTGVVTYNIAAGQTMTLSGATLSLGVVTLTTASAVNLDPGDSATISGATAGSGSYASINGTYTLGDGTTGSTLVYNIATGLAMTIATASVTTGASLSVSVLDVQPTGNMTVTYNAANNTASWNYNGSAAVIQI